MKTKIYSPSRRGFLKGLAVGTGAYVLCSSIIRPDEAMGQSIEGYLEKVSMEDRWNYATGGLIF